MTPHSEADRQAAERYVKKVWAGGTRKMDRLPNYSKEDFLAGIAFERAKSEAEIERLREQVRVAIEVLNWICAIEVALPISWPHYLTIAKRANEALAQLSGGKGEGGV